MLELGKVGEARFLTVPEDYAVTEWDKANLDAAGVTVIPVPAGLRLGESVLYALEIIGNTDDAVRILHGDTLIYDLPGEADDLLAVDVAPDTYEWGSLEDRRAILREKLSTGRDEAESAEVLTGYFMFADGIELRRCLARAKGDFVAAIRSYRDAAEMKLWHATNWLDFGHLQTFYRSRCHVRTQRAFNELDISFRTVAKRSHDRAKIEAEANWFKSLPPPLRRYTPAFLGRGVENSGYLVEYMPLPSLHELFVFGDVGVKTWTHILDACFSFMGDCLTTGTRPDSDRKVIGELTTQKTMDRLAAFEKAFDLSPDQEWRIGGKRTPSLRRIAKMAGQQIDFDNSAFLGVMHGDLCCTNIFYDFRTRQIRVIDPRGFTRSGEPTIFGDVRYDMAKLCHSFVGGYDFILAGRAKWSGFQQRDLTIEFPKDSAIAKLATRLPAFQVNGLRLTDREILGITIHLFLSMLPLHSDRPDRQQGFVANALRLFSMEMDQE